MQGFFFARAFFLGKCLRCLLHASAQPPTPPDPYGPRSGRRLGPAASARSSTRSSSGADCRLAWGGGGQADPRAVHACDGLLHRHCQHGPPTPGPLGRRGAAHGWRNSLGTDTDEVPEQLVCTGIPPPTDLAPEHHELLGATVHQLRVGGSLPALSDPQGGSVVCSCGRPVRDSGDTSVASQHI